MTDLYLIVVALTVAAHFAFIGYLVIGGFLALRWPRTIWLHLPVVAWGVGIVTVKYDCPLTWLEQRARHAAGVAPLREGFIDHYITGVLYPASDVKVVEAVVMLIVVTSWITYAVTMRRRAARARLVNR
jgi:Protein of Unknown function (DUF2784)